MPRPEAGVRVHLVDRVRVDVHERSERVDGVDLREGIEKPILLVRSQYAVILANAQSVVVVVALAGGMWSTRRVVQALREQSGMSPARQLAAMSGSGSTSFGSVSFASDSALK